MPSKTSSIKKQIILYDLRQVGWLSVLYFLALFLIVPLNIIIQYSNQRTREIVMEKGEVFLYAPDLQWILSITVPVFLGVLLFRYMHKKQASDFLHSMPVKRKTLLGHHTIVGLLLLVVPVGLNAIILMTIQAVSGIGDYFNASDVLSWLGIVLFLNVFMFVITVFTSMITGMFTLHFVFTYIFTLLPAAVMFLGTYNLSILLIGFPADYYFKSSVRAYSPITYFYDRFLTGQTGNTVYSQISWLTLTIYAAIAILLYIAAHWLYVHRRLEETSQSIVYPFLRPVFRFGVIICFMMTGGIFFYTGSASLGWAIFGYIAGSLAGFALVEAILYKTWRVYTHYKSFLVVAGFIVLAFLATYLVKNNYENSIPSAEDVERVYFGEYYNYEEQGDPGLEPLYFTNKEDIERVQKLHKQIISTPQDNAWESEEYRSTFIAYELENGEKIARSYVYSLDENTELKSLQSEVENSLLYKHANNAIFNLPREDVFAVDVGSENMKQSNNTVTDPQFISALHEAIKEDIENSQPNAQEALQTYSLDFLTNEDEGYYYTSFDDSYKNTVQVLQEAGIYDDIKVYPEDISSIELNNFDRNKTITVKEESDIKQILDHADYYSEDEDSYLITFNLNRGSGIQEEFSVDYDDLPQSIKNQLEE
jgi:ABC-2 type transport system permease protein